MTAERPNKPSYQRTDEQLAKLKEVPARPAERIVRRLVAGGAKESARDST